MARHPKQTDYERTARHRAGIKLQAAMLGWTPLDTLSAFLTADGELIVIDKALNRYTTTGEADALTSPEPVESAASALVTPVDLTAAEFGPRWQSAREGVGASVYKLNLDTYSHANALSKFTELAAIALRGVELLREHTGPDWREALGLSSEES